MGDSPMQMAIKPIISEALLALPANPDPNLIIGALAYMVWSAREDLEDYKSLHENQIENGG